jgi:hypothetical protein
MALPLDYARYEDRASLLGSARRWSAVRGCAYGPRATMRDVTIIIH